LNDDGDSEAFIKFANGPLTVTIPFSFEIGRNTAGIVSTLLVTAPGIEDYWDDASQHPIQWGNASINAEYEGRGYFFTFGIDNILGPVSRWDDDLGIWLWEDFMTIGKAGGWYDFMNGGARLAVSYGGAVETEWFRSSTVTFDAFGDYPWENIGAEIAGGNADGIAYRFNITPAFAVGLSFANAAMTSYENLGVPPAGGGTWLYWPDENYGAVSDFLLNGVFGMKFDGGIWDLAAMIGWSNYWTHPLADGFFFSHAHYYPDDNLDATMYDAASVPIYLGSTYKINNLLTVGADMSARFLQMGPQAIPADHESGKANDDQEYKPFMFNLGGFVGYGDRGELGGFWGRVEVYALELMLVRSDPEADPFPITGRNQDPEQEKTIGLELSAGFNRTWDDGDFDEEGEGFWGGVWVKFANFLNFEEKGVRMRGGLGYNGLRVLDQLTFNIGGYVESKIAEEVSDIGLIVLPELVWNLIPNGSITFGYKIGLNWNIDEDRLRTLRYDEDATPPVGTGKYDNVLRVPELFNNSLTQHQLDVTFNWSF